MKLHILFGQRKHEDTPEALEIMDEYSRDQNPDFLKNKELLWREPQHEMLSVALVTVEVPIKAIERALFPSVEVIPGTIK